MTLIPEVTFFSILSQLHPSARRAPCKPPATSESLLQAHRKVSNPEVTKHRGRVSAPAHLHVRNRLPLRVPESRDSGRIALLVALQTEATRDPVRPVETILPSSRNACALKARWAGPPPSSIGDPRGLRMRQQQQTWAELRFVRPTDLPERPPVILHSHSPTSIGICPWQLLIAIPMDSKIPV